MRKFFWTLLCLYSAQLFSETLTILSFAENEEATDAEEVTDLATMTTLLQRERQNASFTITAHFGDLAPEEEPALVDVLNEMKIDYAVFCTEKCSDKIAQIKEHLRRAKFSLLGANVINLEGKQPWPTSNDHYIYKLGDIKVGIFGIAEPKCQENADEGTCFCFLPYYETAKQKARALKEEGADVIILFSDLTQSEERWIAHGIHDIDVIISSSSQGPVTWFEDKVLIHRDERQGSYLARIDLVIHKTLTWRGPAISIYPTWRMIHNVGIEPDEKIAAKTHHPKKISRN